MSHRFARLLEPLLRFLLPATGRRRHPAAGPRAGRHRRAVGAVLFEVTS